MPERITYIRATRADLRRMLSAIPRMLVGGATDSLGIAHGFKMRVAFTFLEKVKEAFVTKSRGGTDEAGISWPKLSPKYLAYGRRFGTGEKAALKKGAGLGKGNRYSPGGKDGLLSKAQEARWWAIYKQNLPWLAARESIEIAKGRAAAIAWATLKREGAKTKLEVFGHREVEMLRDTGTLFNSLSPGILTESGATASYVPPGGQVVVEGPGELLVGTNVPYAEYHQGTPDKPGRRPLWPVDGNLPQAWLDDMSESAARGIVKAVELIVRNAA